MFIAGIKQLPQHEQLAKHEQLNPLSTCSAVALLLNCHVKPWAERLPRNRVNQEPERRLFLPEHRYSLRLVPEAFLTHGRPKI